MKPLYMYHGTNMAHFQSILNHGLKKPYLTDLIEIAKYYSEETAGWGDPVVLVVKITDPKKIIVDFKSIDEPVGYKGFTSKDMEDKIDRLTRKINIKKSDWDLTFPITRTVQYDGTIPEKNIKVLRTGP